MVLQEQVGQAVDVMIVMDRKIKRQQIQLMVQAVALLVLALAVTVAQRSSNQTNPEGAKPRRLPESQPQSKKVVSSILDDSRSRLDASAARKSSKPACPATLETRPDLWDQYHARQWSAGAVPRFDQADYGGYCYSSLFLANV